MVKVGDIGTIVTHVTDAVAVAVSLLRVHGYWAVVVAIEDIAAGAWLKEPGAWQSVTVLVQIIRVTVWNLLEYRSQLFVGIHCQYERGLFFLSRRDVVPVLPVVEHLALRGIRWTLLECFTLQDRRAGCRAFLPLHSDRHAKVAAAIHVIDRATDRSTGAQIAAIVDAVIVIVAGGMRARAVSTFVDRASLPIVAIDVNARIEDAHAVLTYLVTVALRTAFTGLALLAEIVVAVGIIGAGTR